MTYPTILFSMLFSSPFGRNQTGGAAEMPDEAVQNYPVRSFVPIDLKNYAASMSEVSSTDRQAIFDYLSRYDFDENMRLYPQEFACYGDAMALGRQMDRFCERFGDYYLDFTKGRVMRVEEDPELVSLLEQNEAAAQTNEENYIDEVEEGAFWLLDAMLAVDEYSGLVNELSGEPMNSLDDAIKVYRDAGGIYDFRVPLQGLKAYLAKHPDQAHAVLADLFYVDYSSYIGSEVPEDDQEAFATFEAAVEDGRVGSALAFQGLYILTAAWENGLGDRFQE